MKRTLIFILLVVISMQTIVFAEADNPVEISAVADGDSVTVSVAAGFQYCAASFELEYDSTRLSFNEGTFAQGVRKGNVLMNPEYSENSVKFSIMSIEAIEAGEICNITFDVKKYANGKAVFKLKNVIFADFDGNKIEAVAAGATVEVQSSHVMKPAAEDYYFEEEQDEPYFEEEPEKTQLELQKTEDAVREFRFVDVSENAWYFEAVKFALERNITTGVSDTEFAPEGRVTRGQFIVMLCRAYDIPPMEGDNFDDCGDTWYTGYLAGAKQLGISNGVGNNCFAPEKEITREEMVTLIYNYIKTAEKVEAVGKTNFADNSEISEWARESVAFASARGYVRGNENNFFNPKGLATRAELAQIFCNMLSNVK